MLYHNQTPVASVLLAPQHACAVDLAVNAIAVRIPLHESSSSIVQYFCAENVHNIVPIVADLKDAK
jgi:hypothetical protein